MKNMKCKCNLCLIGRRLEKISKRLSKKDKHFLLDTLFGMLEDALMDADYRKALLDGTWPKSEIIHKAYLKWQQKRFKEI